MKIIKWLDLHFEEFFMVVFLVLITVVSLMQVIVRNIEVIPSLTWAEEFCRFCWIGSVFLSMAVGLAAGMGYLGLAALLTLVIGLASVLLVSLPVGRGSMNGRELKVTIPENLDYTGIFDDIFAKYTGRAQLLRVKTVNMGSLYEICYRVELKSERMEKEMLDAIRCRNGNLGIVCGRIPEGKEEL